MRWTLFYTQQRRILQSKHGPLQSHEGGSFKLTSILLTSCWNICQSGQGSEQPGAQEHLFCLTPTLSEIPFLEVARTILRGFCSLDFGIQARWSSTCSSFAHLIVPLFCLSSLNLPAGLRSGWAEMLPPGVQALGTTTSLLVSVFSGLPDAVYRVCCLACYSWAPRADSQSGDNYL